MKRGTIDNPKTIRLASILGLERWGAVGILESLWHFTSRHAARGDVGRWSDEEICAAIGWGSEPSRLIDALTTCRWLDKSEQHRLLVHDWHEHCDQGVQRSVDGFFTQLAKTSKRQQKKTSTGSGLAKAKALSNSKKDVSRESFDHLPTELRSPAFSDVWRRWSKFRTETKHPLTDTMIESQLKMLAAKGEAAAIAMIEYTITMGWQGLRDPDPKDTKHGRSTTTGPAYQYTPGHRVDSL